MVRLEVRITVCPGEGRLAPTKLTQPLGTPFGVLSHKDISLKPDAQEWSLPRLAAATGGLVPDIKVTEPPRSCATPSCPLRGIKILHPPMHRSFRFPPGFASGA